MENRKPLIKDAETYFSDPSNWETIWRNIPSTLRLQKLKNVRCVRLCLVDHDINPWIHRALDPIMYFVGATSAESIRKCNEQIRLSNEDIRNLIRHHWEG